MASPPNPGGWITTTARNRAIDHRAPRVDTDPAPRHRPRRHRDAQPDARPDDSHRRLRQRAAIDDDRLRLIFTCCHPALAPEAQVALTLRLLGGLHDRTRSPGRTSCPSPTMAQRLVRAKQKIQAANIPYRVPDGAELPERLAGVLAVLYLVFNEGYAASSGESPRPRRPVRRGDPARPAPGGVDARRTGGARACSR